MKNLKQFTTHAEYEAAQSSLILPNVSICKNVPNEVHYNPYVEPQYRTASGSPYCNGYDKYIDVYSQVSLNGGTTWTTTATTPTLIETNSEYCGYTPPSPDYVEIGGLMWATKNVGATAVTDSGLYFQWGDTQGYTASQVGSGSGKKPFRWSDYKYCNGTSSVMTKYNSTDGLTTLALSDDAAHVNMGGEWRMPTSGDFQTLMNSTTSAWTSSYEGSGVAGMILTSKTDSSKKIFFPLVDEAGRHDSGESSYWMSTLGDGDASYAYAIYFYDGNLELSGVDWTRNEGFPVRGVMDY